MNETQATAATYNQPREWLLWTAAMAAGWLLGTSLNYLLSLVLGMTGLGAALDADPEAIPQSTILVFMGLSLVMLMIMGLSVGVLQWLLLRRQLAGLQQWPIFTALGFALGAFAFPAFMGVGAGLLQWLLLRRGLNKTGWWPVINAVAWPVGYMFGVSLGASLGTAIGSAFVGGLLGAAFTGVIIGAITGAVLLWLLRENRVLLDGLRAEAEQARR
jgi:hypothetical protein